MSNTYTMENSNQKTTVWQIIGRLATAIIVLGITAFFTPGFDISGLWALIAGAVVLTIIDYLISKFTGLRASSFGKGFVGFVLSAIVLYVTQYFVAGYTVSWMAAIVGAFVYRSCGLFYSWRTTKIEPENSGPFLLFVFIPVFFIFLSFPRNT